MAAEEVFRKKEGETATAWFFTAKPWRNLNFLEVLKMKKGFMRCATALVLSAAVLLSAFIVSASAESKSTVQKWDFTKFDNFTYEYAGKDGHAACVSKDGNISLGMQSGQSWWNLGHSLTIENGSVTQTEKAYSNQAIEFVLNFKLTEDLIEGAEYTFTTNLCTKNAPVRPALFYTTAINNNPNWDSWTDVTVPDTAQSLYVATKDEYVTNFTATFTATADMKKDGWLNLRYKTSNKDTITTVSSAALVEKTADETYVSDAVALLPGAQVRYNAPTGLRFITRVNTSLVTELETVGATNIHYGTLIVPEDYLIDTEFTKAALAGKTILDIEYSGQAVAEESKDYFEMKAAIVNIKESNYARKFVARAYVTYTIGGQEYTTYSDYNLVDNSRSVQFVAGALMDDTEAYNALTETQRQSVAKFAGRS